MTDFKIDKTRCIKCGACVKDCPMTIIETDQEGYPFMAPSSEPKCMGCQHCLAVCPKAALSIMGVEPDTCVSVKDAASAGSFDALVRTRRSVRQYKNKNVDKKTLETIISTAANAPTGKNTKTVRLHIIDDMEQMKIFKEKAICVIEEKDAKGEIPSELRMFVSVAKAYRKGNDILFRGAPHLVLATAPENGVAPEADAFITLSYFELTAASAGLGTVWLGFLMYLFKLAPELLDALQIPKDHTLAYALLLGEPSVKYQRGVKRDKIDVSRITFSD